MKVFELAKKLGKSSKEILQAADYLEILIKSHLSSLSEEEVKQIIKYFRKKRFLLFYKKYFSLFLLIFLLTILFSIINPQSVLSGEVDASLNELGELTLDWEFDDSVESAILLIETDSELFLIEVFESGGNTIECCYDENLAVTLFLTDKEGNEEELETKNIEVSNNISTTSTSSTTTTTLAPTTTTTLAECNDEDFKPYTLYDSDGNANTVLTCRNQQDALDLGYIYTTNPNPPTTTTQSSTTSTSTTSTTTTQPTTTTTSTTTTQPTTTTTSFNFLPASEEIYRTVIKCKSGIKSGKPTYYFLLNSVIKSDSRDIEYKLAYTFNDKKKETKWKKFPKKQNKNLTLKAKRWIPKDKHQINTFEYFYIYKLPNGDIKKTSPYTVDEKLPCGKNGVVTTTTSIVVSDRKLRFTDVTDGWRQNLRILTPTTTLAPTTTTTLAPTTTTTLAPTTTTTLAECNDEDFQPYTLYDSEGNANTVMSCLNEQDALNLNYSYTVNPNPPPVSSPTTTTTSTTTTTLPSTINISTGETYITSCAYNSNPAGTRSYRKYFTNNGSQAIYLQHTSSMVAAQLINPGDTKTIGQYGATHGANSRLYKAAFTEAGLSDTEFITRNFNLDCQADIDITHSLASCAGSKGSRTRESSLSFTNNESETAYVNTRYSTNGGSSWSSISTVTVSAGATVNGPYYVVSNGGSIIWQSHRGFGPSSNVDFSDSDYYTQNTSNTIDCPDGYYVNVDGSNTYSLTLSCKKWNDNSKSSFRGNPWWGSQSTARSYMFALIALTGDYDDGDSDVEVTDYFNYPDSGNCFGIVNEAWFPWKRQNDAYVGWSFYAPEWNSSSTSSSWSSNDYENFVFAELVP